MLQLYKTDNPERSPIDTVIKLDYSQTIFPKAAPNAPTETAIPALFALKPKSVA